MPCYPMVVKRAAKLGIQLPEKVLNDQEVRAIAGAIDHEDMHRIVDSMTDNEFLEFVRKLQERMKRKRREAAMAYVSAEAHYHG